MKLVTPNDPWSGCNSVKLFIKDRMEAWVRNYSIRHHLAAYYVIRFSIAPVHNIVFCIIRFLVVAVFLSVGLGEGFTSFTCYCVRFICYMVPLIMLFLSEWRCVGASCYGLS